MALFQTLYTGSDSAVKLPDLDKLTESQRRVGEMAIKGEEAKLSKRLSDQAKTAEMLQTNPVALIADRNRTVQALGIEEFNNKWGAKAAETAGELSFTDRLEMQRDKDALTGLQQQLQVDEQRYVELEKMLKQDTRGYYDKDRFRQATEEFFETGVLPQDALVARPRDLRSALANSQTSFTVETIPQELMIGGVQHRRDVTTNMTEDEARRYVADTMLSDEGYTRYAIEDFLSQPEEVQARYLDANDDGVIDPAERQAVNDVRDINNPIVRWAQDEYAKYARQTKAGTTQRIITPPPPTRSTGGYDPKQPVSPTNNKNEEFPEAKSGVRIGGFVFDSFVHLPRGAASEQILTVSKAWNEDGTAIDIPTAGQIDVELVGYSPSADQLVVRVKNSVRLGATASGGVNYIRQGTTLIIPAEEHDPKLRRAFDIDRTAYPSFGGKGVSEGDARSRMEALRIGK